MQSYQGVARMETALQRATPYGYHLTFLDRCRIRAYAIGAGGLPTSPFESLEVCAISRVRARWPPAHPNENCMLHQWSEERPLLKKDAVLQRRFRDSTWTKRSKSGVIS